MRSFSNNNIQDFQDFFTLVGDFAKVGFAHFDAVTCEGYALSHWYRNVGEKEGRPLTEIINVYEHLHPEDRIILQHFLKEAVEGTSDALKQDVRILHEDRHITWTRINMIVRRRCPEKHIFEMLCINFDITQTKEIEAKLIKAKEQAEEADTLKSAFIANMSHEIRTPLNAIVGFSNLLAKTVDADKKQRFINIINKNNQMLLKLIGDVLDMAKVESNTLDFNFRPTDLNHLIQEVDSTMRIKLSNDVMLNYVLGAPDCIIDTDPDRLNQVLMNLLNNAAKFTTKGSITFGYELRDDEIYFYVRDTGIGIPDQDAERLFSRFTKLNNFIPGTGLGLSISKSIVEMLGGSIGVKSAGHNRGSIFWFTIPNKQVSAMSEINEIYFREVN